MRIVVTGTSGQLVRSLLERAAVHSALEIVAIGRPLVDLSDSKAVSEAIRRAAPDVVINAAAYTAVDQAEAEPELAFAINADAAGVVAAAAADARAAVVQISTDYVFDGSATTPYREDAKVNPLGAYGRSKLAGEEQVRNANPRHAIVRTAWVYSPFGRNFLKSILSAAQTRDKLTVVDDQRGSPTCALDLADALLALVSANYGWGETYHVAGRGEATWCEFAREIMACSALYGLPHVPVVPITTKEWPTPAIRPASSVLDSSKFERMFGFALPLWRESTERLIKRIAHG